MSLSCLITLLAVQKQVINRQELHYHGDQEKVSIASDYYLWEQLIMSDIKKPAGRKQHFKIIRETGIADGNKHYEPKYHCRCRITFE